MTRGGLQQVPFTLLTGFLGTGKTTTLNRMLRNPGGRRVAVLVNELGRISIDSQLIVGGGGDVLELAGGCLCCKVDIKNDLWDGIVDVIKRSVPDHVVLETTGIAEPQIILDDLAERLSSYDSEVAKRVTQAGVVCVVDPASFVADMAKRQEVREQIECADRILLSKLDLASPEQVADAHQRLHEVNPEAERASFPAGEEASLSNWLLAPAPYRPPRARRSGHAHHGAQVVAVAFENSAAFALQPLRTLLEDLGPMLLRAKGIVKLAGQDGAYLVEYAGGRVSISDAPQAHDVATSQLVLIGEELDESALRRRLWACQPSVE